MSTRNLCGVCDRAGKTTLSPAMQLLTILWENRTEEVGHSWLTINQCMREGLFLAIKMGLTFYPEDINYIHSQFRAGYWIGDTGVEDFYRESVLARNASGWKSVEHCRKRKPFIIPGSEYISRSYGIHTASISRLMVGASFKWEGVTVRVTSFNDEAEPPYLIACSYRQEKTESGGRTYTNEKLEKRFKITHDDIAAMRKREREVKKALEEQKAKQEASSAIQ